MISVDMSQVARLAHDLAVAGPKMAVAAEIIVGQEADAVKSDAAARAPRLTGELAAGFYVRDGGRGEKIVANDVPYAIYQELGTSRHGPQPSLFPAGEAGGDRMAVKVLAAADPL